MIPRNALLGALLAFALTSNAAFAAEVVTLDGVTLDSEALDNGCSTETLPASEIDDCRYRVCFALLKSLWLSDEAQRRNLDPDAETMEEQQQEFEKSNMGEQLTFTVLPRLKFQRQAIELYRSKRADNPEYSFDDLWDDVETSSTELEIPERALRALVTTYGQDEARFLEFQQMFPNDYETALERSRNSWEREARRVALEKAISPQDELTSGEMTKARTEWQKELELAPDATDKMLRQRKREYSVNQHIRKHLSENGKFADEKFREGLLAWIDQKILGPDEAVFGE